MACPHVSGVIALMKAGDNTLTPDDIKNRIKNLKLQLCRLFSILKILCIL